MLSSEIKKQVRARDERGHEGQDLSGRDGPLDDEVTIPCKRATSEYGDDGIVYKLIPI